MTNVQESSDVGSYTLPPEGLRISSVVPPQLRAIDQLMRMSSIPCEIVRPSGEVLRYGDAPPEFRLRLKSDDAFRRGIEELAIARAYVEGDFEFELDMSRALDVRENLKWKPPVGLIARVWLTRMLRPLTRENHAAIQSHYSLGDDFYLKFIDKRWRFYSHGLFHSEDESIEEASEHKLERMYSSLQLEPGMRLLDIGAGWGGVEQYCGIRGVKVTALTIAPDSHAFVSRLIKEHDLPAEVHLQDFLTHVPAEPYDAIVIYGVIEHIPNYKLFIERVWECLKPGGRIYIDASASRQKYRVSSFSRTYIWPGSHTFLCLQDLIREILYHGMDVIEVKDESRDYELTMRQWAERLDASRDEISARWGEQIYRAFRLYLWGGTRSFHHHRIEAYSIVAGRTEYRGPRPGLIRRGWNGFKGML
ncbi:MAG TPA: class I SAM-dependent methyltransferase [Gemmatimonadaceae bacterium]|nr:class I SAM-dependent methyltransferase [Gemmatimonadaceae bacterium]